VRKILDIAFPGLSLADQLERTWITEAVLCSAPKECGGVVRAVEQECRERYLVAQLSLFPNARIVALGHKAWKRLRGIPGVTQACHPAHRRKQEDAEESWRRAVEGLLQDKGGSQSASPDLRPNPIRK
jgi:uracil-DNA glycosylase